MKAPGLLQVQDEGFRAKRHKNSTMPGSAPQPPGSSFVNNTFSLLWKTLFRSIQKDKSGRGTLKNIMCAMTRDLLNIVYITCIDILRIIFYAALPFTVLADETAKSVWNTWSHLLPGTVNNDLL